MLRGLKNRERIIYRSNGNRCCDAASVLKRLRVALPRIGVTRVADISYLAAQSYPVFQSVRPQILYHSKTGQNTGAQGKGKSPEQAKISCLMETVEGYCQEPRQESLIRGSYRFLKNQHLIVHPKHFAAQYGKNAKVTEPLMWTEAVSLDDGRVVLVPAEAVYFPFLPRDYNTREVFVSSSNGVGAGITYLEAVTHAIYEAIERHYFGLWEQGKIKARAFFSEELEKFVGIKQFKMSMQYDIEVVALEIPAIKNLPMVMCWLVSENNCWFYGAGCSADTTTAIDRAVSESLQGFAVKASGSREDMVQPETIGRRFDNLPKHQSLPLAHYRRRVLDKNFKTLQAEYEALLLWLRQAGFDKIFVANLTRVGIDLPVVKVLIPGLLHMQQHRHGLTIKTQDIQALRFGWGSA